jgi:hypothetical protein
MIGQEHILFRALAFMFLLVLGMIVGAVASAFFPSHLFLGPLSAAVLGILIGVGLHRSK